MKAIKFLLTLLFSMAVAACGGGGGGTPTAASTIISGTAATGAPVVGYVSVRDSSANDQPVRTNIPIAANGNYSVDVAGLTAPFAFLASGTVGGRTVSLYSAATSADVGGTINITPFTDLMIRNIAATAVDTFLAGGGMASLTTAQLNAQRVALTERLEPALTAMGLSGTIDLLRATFNADNTGLDRFMDAVRVDTTDPTAVTITNILNAATRLVIDTTASRTALAAGGTLGTLGLALSGTPLDAMLAATNAFSALFATTVPNSNNAALQALFSTTFREDGQELPAFLTEITTDPSNIGLRFTNLVVDSVDTVTGTAQVRFTVTGPHGGGSEVINMQMLRDGPSGPWQMNGNRRIAGVHVQTTAERDTCNPATTCANDPTYRTGLNISIQNDAMQPIGSVVVTGPGLPARTGVTLARQDNQTWFNITTSNSLCPGGCGSTWSMTDGAINDVLPNSVYTVTLYDLNGAAIPGAIYTEVVRVKPVLNTAMAALAYPSISGMVNLANIGTVTLTPSWTVPAGLSGDTVSVNVWQTGSNATQHIRADAYSASGTATLAITAPSSGTWTYGNYWINARDQYGGKVSTNYRQ